MNPEIWLNELLKKRRLERPDGRMLYGYRLTNDEYQSLRETLHFVTSFGQLNEVAKKSRRFPALFVLYASEWWRREYDGGAWSWTPIIQSFGGDVSEFPANVRSDSVVSGFAYWGHRPKGEGRKYFGSIVAHGGLPLNFISHGGGKLSSLLEYSIRLAGRYSWNNSQIVDAIYERANELPESLRRQEIFELIASMVTAVLEIKEEFGLAGMADPISVLGEKDPDWRQRFPLPLDDQAAQTLLSGLVQEAAKQLPRTTSAIFTVERLLKDLGEERYQLVSSLLCPQVVETESFAALFGLPSTDSLPRYFNIDVQLQSREPLVDGRRILGSQVAKVALTSRKRTWSGMEACSEHSLILCDPNGHLKENLFSIPGGGEVLQDEPWIFVFRDGQNKWVASGSARVPEDEALVTLPNGWEIQLEHGSSAVKEGVCELDGKLIPIFKVQGDIRLIDGEIKYRIRTRQSIDSSDTYVWEGRKYSFPSTPQAIYLGTPNLFRYSIDGVRTRIASAELKWFVAGTRISIEDPSFARGPLDVLRIREGEIIAKFRIVVIDKASLTKFVSGPSTNAGKIILDGWGCSDAAIEKSAELEVETSKSLKTFEFDLNAGIVPPESVAIELHWLHCPKDVRLILPFPCSGGRFFNSEGNPLHSREVLSVKNLMGGRIRVFDRNPQQPKHYEVVMTLRGTHLKVTKPIFLSRDGSAEIRLIDLQRNIETLMGFSDSLDATVEVALNANDAQVSSIYISRYEFSLIHLPGRIAFSTDDMAKLDTDRLTNVRMLAMPFTLLDNGNVQLNQEQSENVPTGQWILDNLDPEKAPWLIYPEESTSVYFRPTVWARFDSYEIEEKVAAKKCPLAKAMMIGELEDRKNEINSILDSMSCDFSHQSWHILDHLLKTLHHLPLSSLDVFRQLVAKPEMVVAFMLRSQLTLDELVDLSRRFRDELGLVWELTSIPMWENAVRSFWSYWLNMLEREAATVSFPIVLNDRFQSLVTNVPSLKPILDFVLYEATGKISDELDILWEQTDQSAAARLLWNGSNSLGNSLLFIPHANDEKWPTEKSFFESAWQGFVTASDQQIQNVVATIVKDLFWIRLGDFKLAVANAPILCALWATTGAKQDWWDDPERRLALRKLRAFDPVWFEQAFKQAIAACICVDALIYPNSIVNYDGVQ